jgi:hypothetical protein
LFVACLIDCLLSSWYCFQRAKRGQSEIHKIV